MTLFLIFFTTFSFAAGDDRLEIRDPKFYEILEKNSALDCRYVIDDAYGFLLERGGDDVIHVSLITNGVNEGAKSAFDAVIKIKAEWKGLYVYHYSRKENFGRYIEFELLNRRNPRLGYRLSGTSMMTSAMYTKGEDGKETENLYPDASRRISCEIL